MNIGNSSPNSNSLIK